ncbi:nicotinate-nucleotide pyrophosphorylase (carboxylating) [Virgibacillus natechei]|uniref:nicotinate-nucleotide diphosphorylase (carboxylating) n=1 Tax=Virgibacillus natechei TaxID=1216297 RepID=A0ABS4IE57_9BACI|nr:carboxylating nicotinate-nucleotide diphosphorylase [Virgibacillus natechei]MBP1969222.1 nicotinate-nucleotide pyrophosphorylase (carboxylating) [Virgibacillus natechei]UZD12385.1 carboxylating nicotinate-nucleotide diphosphorylase [Virgibacillus natechei]
MNKIKLRTALQSFLIEDIGDADRTSTAIFPPDQLGKGIFLAKEEGIIAGLALIEESYHLLDPTIEVEIFYKDGDQVYPGDEIATVSGPILCILSGERVILNLIQRMSGIASMTKKCAETLNDDTIEICDTRKTSPGLRMFEKYAVTAGGGKNHRFGLYDGIMIKDNHIAFCGSISKAVRAARQHSGHMTMIEVEAETKAQVIEAVEANADRIMFDNRNPDEVKELATYVPKHIVTEASGGITLDNLTTYQHTGVDYISLGFITHSIKALDISLNID